jgi:Zn-dependent M28 family amino/carboxypeptidase
MAMTDSLETTETVLRRHAHALCKEIGPRTIQGGGLAEAERYLADALTALDLTPARQSYTFGGQEVANLICEVGDGSSDPLIVGAHYDTVPGTEGADDNASAVCVLLALANRLAARPPPMPVRLVAFTLEEPPAFLTHNQGSRVFCRRMRQAGERPRGAIVLEMVGYTAARQSYPLVLSCAGYPRTGDYIGIVGNLRSRHLTCLLKRGFRRNPDLPVETLSVPLNGWVLGATRLSDHSSFWDRGWPAVMVTDTAFFRNPYYHTPADRMETLDFRFMARLVDSLELGLAELAADGP